MDNQVGLFEDGGTSVVSELGYNIFYCGFDKSLRLKDSSEFSKKEWSEVANAVIEELRIEELEYELHFIDHNGFILVEI